MAMPISFVERIGARTILHLGAGEASAKAVFENDAGFETGQALHFTPHASAVRLFDAASGAALGGH
jgi:multiple sugar transport system ATP-binding protein